MSKKILVVADSQGIIVRGIDAKLKTIGVDPAFSFPKVKDLSSNIPESELIIFCLESIDDKTIEAIIYIKDYCAENDKRIIVIASDEHYAHLPSQVTDRFVLNHFERPINMDKMLDAIESYLEKGDNTPKRKSILIVDDDVSYMSMIMDWLSDNYRVSLANSGMEAITYLAGNQPDLILLDYEMPITTGPQVMQMIKSSPQTADIPIMFLTGKSDRDSIMAVLDLKPVGYLLKSVDKKGLNDSIANFFASQKAK